MRLLQTVLLGGYLYRDTMASHTNEHRPSAITSTEAFEQLSFLARSPNRVSVLEALNRRPRSRNELLSLIDTSRPTLVRVLSDFESYGWIERTDSEYTTTPVGSAVAEAFSRALETVSTVDRLRGLLTSVPDDVLTVDVEAFSDATVTTAAPGVPFRPVQRLVELADASTTFREFNRSSIGCLCDTELSGLLSGDGRVTVVYGSAVVESLVTSSDNWFGEAIRTGRVDVFVHDDLPFGLSLFDDRVALAGYDETTGAPTTLVDTDAVEVRRWAEAVYETYRQEATPLYDGGVALGTNTTGSSQEHPGHGTSPDALGRAVSSGDITM